MGHLLSYCALQSRDLRRSAPFLFSTRRFSSSWSLQSRSSGLTCERFSVRTSRSSPRILADERNVGKPLIDQPVIRQKFAAMLAKVEAGQSWLEHLTFQMCVAPPFKPVLPNSLRVPGATWTTPNRPSVSEDLWGCSSSTSVARPERVRLRSRFSSAREVLTWGFRSRRRRCPDLGRARHHAGRHGRLYRDAYARFQIRLLARRFRRKYVVECDAEAAPC